MRYTGQQKYRLYMQRIPQHFLLSDCTVNPIGVVGDDRVESRLFAGATFLPSIRGYPHNNILV